MNIKQKFIYKVLHKYGVLVDFDGEPRTQNVAGPVEGENYRSWCLRVIGIEPDDVVVFLPMHPKSQKTMHRLNGETDMEFLIDIIRQVQRNKDHEAAEELERIHDEHKDKIKTVRSALKQKTELQIATARNTFESIGVDSLQDMLADTNLEPSVTEFLKSFAAEKEGLDAESLFRELVKKYNEVVKSYRQLMLSPAA